MKFHAAPWPRIIPQFSIQFLLLITTCVAVASALGRTVRVPTTYFRAECIVQVESSMGATTDGASAETIAAQLFSEEVLQSVSRRREIALAFGNRPDVVRHLARGLAVEPSDEGQSFRIAYHNRDGDIAVEVVEAVIEEFVRLNNCRVSRHGMLIRAVSV